jgi:hypothetical protein
VKKYQHLKPCLYTNKGYMSSVKNTHKLTSLYKIGLFKGWQKKHMWSNFRVWKLHFWWINFNKLALKYCNSIIV